MACCPKCDYDLTGLPEEYKCPECGFEYDRHARIVEFASCRTYYQKIVACAAVLVWLWWRARISVLIPVFVVIAMAFSVLRVLTNAGKPSRMILNKRGVLFDCPSLRGRFVEWPEVGKAEYGWFLGRFSIHGPSGEKLLACRFDAFGVPSMARACVLEINRHKRLYEYEARSSETMPKNGRADPES